MIYAIQSGKRKRVKIGFTSMDGDRRLVTMQTGSADKLNLLAECWGTRRLEAAIHEHLRQDRIAGEWFKLSLRAQELIKGMAIGPEGAYLVVSGGSIEGYITEAESKRLRDAMTKDKYMEYRGMLTGNRRLLAALNWGR